ncbi:MAG: secondary thiamine-phosphate synthase enzyme YjbQ [archaeon]
MPNITIDTAEELQFLDITQQVQAALPIADGAVLVYSLHTTLCIIINEYEELLLKDMRAFLQRLSPAGQYEHDKIHLRNCPPDEPENAKSHLQCMLMPVSQIIPVVKGKLQLGTYQRIIAVETSGPRKRTIVVQGL